MDALTPMVAPQPGQDQLPLQDGPPVAAQSGQTVLERPRTVARLSTRIRKRVIAGAWLSHHSRHASRARATDR